MLVLTVRLLNRRDRFLSIQDHGTRFHLLAYASFNMRMCMNKPVKRDIFCSASGVVLSYEVC